MRGIPGRDRERVGRRLERGGEDRQPEHADREVSGCRDHRLVGSTHRSPELADRVDREHAGDLVAVTAVEVSEHRRSDLERAIEHETGQADDHLAGAREPVADQTERVGGGACQQEQSRQPGEDGGHDDHHRCRAADAPTMRPIPPLPVAVADVCQHRHES